MAKEIESLVNSVPKLILTPHFEIKPLSLEDSDDISDELTGPSWDDMHRWVSWAQTKEGLSRSAHKEIVLKNIRGFYAGENYFGVSRQKGNQKLGPQVTLYNIDIAEEECEFGYWTPKEMTNQGYTQETGAAMLLLGFQYYGLKKIFAKHGRGNDSSERILTKLGFEFSHVTNGGSFRGSGEEIDTFYYMLEDVGLIPACHIRFN